jgi:cell division protein FtsL
MASYVYGNTVRKDVPVIQKPEKQPKEISQRVRNNRTKALHMSKRYVVFLAIAASVALFACVRYLQLQSEITERSKHITAMQIELEDAKEENTTRYNAIVNSMNLEVIRDKAMNELGMVYAEAGQVIEYQNPANHLITQYANIPESGIVASQKQVK